MTRSWDEAAAAVFDVIPAPLLLLALLVLAGVGGPLWYWYPAWLPRGRTGRAASRATTGVPVPDDEPVLTAAEPEDEPPAPRTRADQLAAEGRFAEAIRQRLRDIIRDLVTAGVLAPQPGWTVAELAVIAAAQRPGTAGPFGAATVLFSEIWYGDRPAGRAQDDHMRTLTDQVRAELRAVPR